MTTRLRPIRTIAPPGSTVGVGTSAPLGATVRPGGVNFSIYSRSATRVDLLLFDGEGAREPSRVIPLDPAALPEPRAFSDEQIQGWLAEDEEGMRQFREGV